MGHRESCPMQQWRYFCLLFQRFRRGNVKVRNNLYSIQMMRASYMDASVSDFPERLSPASYLAVCI